MLDWVGQQIMGELAAVKAAPVMFVMAVLLIGIAIFLFLEWLHREKVATLEQKVETQEKRISLLTELLKKQGNGTSVYYHGQDQANELTTRPAPKLTIFFDRNDPICVHDTFLGTNEADQVCYIAVVPLANTEATITDCQGWLANICRLGPDNETWEATSFTIRLPLEWSALGFDAIDINPGTRQALNVVRVSLTSGHFSPCTNQWLNKDAKIFEDRHGVFRFDIIVVGKNCSAPCSLRLQIDPASNRPSVATI